MLPSHRARSRPPPPDGEPGVNPFKGDEIRAPKPECSSPLSFFGLGSLSLYFSVSKLQNKK